MSDILKSFPVVAEIRIRWGDMDSFQHVNNTVYFRYFETARIEYFTRVGFMNILEKYEIGPILGSTSCRFKIPLTYPDTIYVGSKMKDMSKKSFTMEHIILSEKISEVVAEGKSHVVCYNFQDSKTTNIPEFIHSSIEKMEGQKF